MTNPGSPESDLTSYDGSPEEDPEDNDVSDQQESLNRGPESSASSPTVDASEVTTEETKDSKNPDESSPPDAVTSSHGSLSGDESESVSESKSESGTAQEGTTGSAKTGTSESCPAKNSVRQERAEESAMSAAPSSTNINSGSNSTPQATTEEEDDDSGLVFTERDFSRIGLKGYGIFSFVCAFGWGLSVALATYHGAHHSPSILWWFAIGAAVVFLLGTGVTGGGAVKLSTIVSSAQKVVDQNQHQTQNQHDKRSE